MGDFDLGQLAMLLLAGAVVQLFNRLLSLFLTKERLRNWYSSFKKGIRKVLYKLLDGLVKAFAIGYPIYKIYTTHAEATEVTLEVLITVNVWFFILGLNLFQIYGLFFISKTQPSAKVFDLYSQTFELFDEKLSLQEKHIGLMSEKSKLELQNETLRELSEHSERIIKVMDSVANVSKLVLSQQEQIEGLRDEIKSSRDEKRDSEK